MTTFLIIDGFHAVIQYDPDTALFRGEFQHLRGGADFYAKTYKQLVQEGKTSLRVFLELCREKGVPPH